MVSTEVEIKYVQVVPVDFLSLLYFFDKDATRLPGPGSLVALALGFICCQCCSNRCPMRFPSIREAKSFRLRLYR